jgi:hypothetical protein
MEFGEGFLSTVVDDVVSVLASGIAAMLWIWTKIQMESL